MKNDSRLSVDKNSIYRSENNKKKKNGVSMAAMFSKGMEIFDDAFIGLTNDFKITVWSKGAEKKFGYQKSEITGKSVKLLVPKDKLSEIDDEIHKVMSGNIVEGYETVRLHKNGRTVDVSISIAPVYGSDGTINGAIAIYKDVTERKKLVRKLDEYEKKCMIALEGGQFGVWDFDIQNKKVFHFNNWEKTLGYEENELDNCVDTWISLIHPDDLPEVDDKYGRHLQSKEEYVVEYRIRCKNNAYKWIRSKGRVSEWGEDGVPLRMIGTNEEISKERIIQEELKEKCEQLALMKKEAESANKAKSQFLANMSHENTKIRSQTGICCR